MVNYSNWITYLYDMKRLAVILSLQIIAVSLFSQRLGISTGSFIAHVAYESGCIVNVPSDDPCNTYKREYFNVPFNRFVIRPQVGITYRESSPVFRLCL